MTSFAVSTVRQLPNVPANQIIAEPAQRNTAPAIGLAAHILESVDPDAIFGVFPSDHVIGNPKRFLSLVRAAFRAAEKDQIAVLGVEPRWPETGYGFTSNSPKRNALGKLEAAPVKRFREKPELKEAKKFLRAGNFYWNAGMFFWKAAPPSSTVFASTSPRPQPSSPACRRSVTKISPPALPRFFPLCENISIDYAVAPARG